MSMSGINSNIGQSFKSISNSKPSPQVEETPVEELSDFDKVGGAENRDDVEQQTKSDETIDKQKAEKPKSKTQITSKELNRILLKQDIREDRIEKNLLNEIKNMAEVATKGHIEIPKHKLEVGKKEETETKEEKSKHGKDKTEDSDDSKYFLGSSGSSGFNSDTGGDGNGQGDENKKEIMEALREKHKKGGIPQGLEELVHKMPNSNLSLESKIKVVEACNNSKSELDSDGIKNVMNVCSSNSFIALPEKTKDAVLNFISSKSEISPVNSGDIQKGTYQKISNLTETGVNTLNIGNISVKKEESTSKTGVVTNSNEISSKTADFELNVSLVEQGNFSETPKLVDDALLGSSLEISFKTKPNEEQLNKELSKIVDVYNKESDIKSIPQETMKQIIDVSLEQMKSSFDIALNSLGSTKLASLRIPITQDRETGELNLHSVQIGADSELSLSSSDKPINVNNMNTFIKERNMQKSLVNQESLISKLTDSFDIFNKQSDDNKNFSFKTCGGVPIKSGETINVNFILKANDIKRF